MLSTPALAESDLLSNAPFVYQATLALHPAMRVMTATAFVRVSSFARLYTGRHHYKVHLSSAATLPARRLHILSLTSKKCRSALRCIPTSPQIRTTASTSEPHGSTASPTLDELKNKHGLLSHVKKLITTTTTSVFVSTTTNPYHNLALENYLLTQSSHDTNILFLYTNSPCVVIGRNQNPWVECDLEKVRDGLPRDPTDKSSHNHTHDGDKIQVDLLRRRSGGGTVVHSPGNLNYCAIVPNDKAFKRRTHAEMVTRALRSLQADSITAQFPDFAGREVKVNERHDIVMQSQGRDDWLKVSGSAFKLKRGRALHHGTLLVASPYLSQISSLLRSPGKDLITTKGVESVRSSVGNLYSGDCTESQRDELTKMIETAIIEEFNSMYGAGSTPSVTELGDRECEDSLSPAYHDARELAEDGWKFGQTPRFTFTLPNSEPDSPPVFTFEANRGLIEKATIKLDGKKLDFHRSDPNEPPHATDNPDLTLPSQLLHSVEYEEWRGFLGAMPFERSQDALDDAETKADQNAGIDKPMQPHPAMLQVSTVVQRCFPHWHLAARV